MSNFFQETIDGWDSWGKCFQSIPAFYPLIEEIFRQERLPFGEIGPLTPGTNGVFRVGDYVIKVYAPEESGIDSLLDAETEIFAGRYAEKLGLSAPKVVAAGEITDRYRFPYLIMEYAAGEEFTKVFPTLTGAEKKLVGQRLRQATDAMNKTCPDFQREPIFARLGSQFRWNRYSARFNGERVAYVSAHFYSPAVFVHGDINGDNLLVDKELEICFLDFADAQLAPVEYEQALIACELFCFDKDAMSGYFHEKRTDEELAEYCMSGLLLHDFGGDIIGTHLAPQGEVDSLNTLRRLLLDAIRTGRTKRTVEKKLEK